MDILAARVAIKHFPSPIEALRSVREVRWLPAKPWIKIKNEYALAWREFGGGEPLVMVWCVNPGASALAEKVCEDLFGVSARLPILKMG